MRWLIESDVFEASYRARMTAAIHASGHAVTQWDDAWWDLRLPGFEEPVVFHGSLGNAARIVESARWSPGAYCRVDAFRSSAWYPRAGAWLLHSQYRVLPARELVESAAAVVESLGGGSVFVRPDSPLKPFSGRVLPATGLTLQALDHGFYYSDAELPVVVAPVRTVGREWRYVVVNREVISGSGYVAEGRKASQESPGGLAWETAASIAADLDPPEAVYVLDLCEVDGELRLIELNPFSGADLYACDLAAVVAAVSEISTG